MLEAHPTDNGDYMYINFSNMQSMIEKLDQTVCCLAQAREKIEYERKRLSYNSELEDVIAALKKEYDKLENEILTAKQLKISLIKISELYINGEERIKDTIESGILSGKISFVPFCKLSSNLDFRWTIE